MTKDDLDIIEKARDVINDVLLCYLQGNRPNVVDLASTLTLLDAKLDEGDMEDNSEFLQKKCEEQKKELDEIRGIVGFPGTIALEQHNLTESLPDVVRYCHRQWLDQTHKANERCNKSEAYALELNRNLEQLSEQHDYLYKDSMIAHTFIQSLLGESYNGRDFHITIPALAQKLQEQDSAIPEQAKKVIQRLLFYKEKAEEAWKKLDMEKVKKINGR